MANIIKYDDLVFFIEKKKMKKKDFFKMVKVKKNSYLYNIYDRMYDFMLKGKVNLYKEYIKYYKKEYKDFSEYLSEKYHMNEEMKKMFENKKSCYKKYDLCCDQPILALMQDDEVKEIICKFMGGYVYDY